MNYDDKFTKGFEEKFQKNLAAVRAMKPEDYENIQKNVNILNELLGDFIDKPDKTPQEIEFVAEIKQRMMGLLEKIGDIQIILDENLYRKSRAQYEYLKKLAKEGNKEAEKLYLELKPYVEKFDVN